jgi:hypothetical protein
VHGHLSGAGPRERVAQALVYDALSNPSQYVDFQEIVMDAVVPRTPSNGPDTATP